MIIFFYLLINILFVWAFYIMWVWRLSILPVIVSVLIIFWLNDQLYKDKLKATVETNTLTLSRNLILIWFYLLLVFIGINLAQILIISLFLNFALMISSYIFEEHKRSQAFLSAIYVTIAFFTIYSIYCAIIYKDLFTSIKMLWLLGSVILAMWSVYYFIVRLFVKIPKDVFAQWLIVVSLNIVLFFMVAYLETNILVWLILSQVFLLGIFYTIYLVKADNPDMSESDIDLKQILRWHKIWTRITRKPRWQFQLLGTKFDLKELVLMLPDYFYNFHVIASIVATILFCGFSIYYWQTDQFYISDLIYFIINTIIYIVIFYICRRLAIQNNLWRVFGFFMINICYFVIISNIFGKDTISILFWWVLWSVLNNFLMSFSDNFSRYLSYDDFRYRLFSNFLWLIINSYFFLTLDIDIIVKIWLLIIVVWIWLMSNTKNIKMYFLDQDG